MSRQFIDYSSASQLSERSESPTAMSLPSSSLHPVLQLKIMIFVIVADR